MCVCVCACGYEGISLCWHCNVDFVLFHNITCHTKSIWSPIHVNTCTLVAISMILWSLECIWMQEFEEPPLIKLEELPHWLGDLIALENWWVSNTLCIWPMRGYAQWPNRFWLDSFYLCHKDLTSYRLVANSSQMVWTRMIIDTLTLKIKSMTYYINFHTQCKSNTNKNI
jgi:hypothetical protein